ncbi:hypothetical protein DSO57_1011472 [Entomophthora muscae]|uniref:Uncharacterized protein n=1 Tax=Entomophthora muscae TaxID=34485 RepID=A0ACC2RXD3_9FUNG|nr:hypothetical protein DSO57_1011472 [Entomophthora muscae]
MKFLFLLSIANAYLFEDLVTRPRSNIRSFNTHERLQYFAPFKLKPKAFKKNMEKSAKRLAKLPMDFEAYPAWTGKFLNETEHLIKQTILYWDWTTPGDVWMFDPILPASFPCVRKNDTFLNKEVCTLSQSHQFEQVAEKVENAESVGDAGLIIASYMPKLAFDLTSDHRMTSLYHNPIIFSILAYNQVLFCRYLKKNPKWEDKVYDNNQVQPWGISVKEAIKDTISRC